MRRLLKDISEKRQLGDVTTLANEGVVNELTNLATEAKAAEDSSRANRFRQREGAGPVGRPLSLARNCHPQVVGVAAAPVGLSSSSQIFVACVSFSRNEPTTNVTEATMIG